MFVRIDPCLLLQSRSSHDMETFSALFAICEAIYVTGEIRWRTLYYGLWSLNPEQAVEQPGEWPVMTLL